MLLDQKRTVDPRDNLDRAHRRELVEFARANGLDVDENMPADDIEGRPGTGLRNMLRAKGITRISVPRRSIDNRVGDKTFPMKAKPAPVPQATSDEWADFQAFKAWKAAHQKPAVLAPTVAPVATAEKPRSEINALRDECKRLGVKMDRRDKTADLKAKIEAHRGENAS